MCFLWAAPPYRFPRAAIHLNPGLELLRCLVLARSMVLKLNRVLQRSVCSHNRFPWFVSIFGCEGFGKWFLGTFVGDLCSLQSFKFSPLFVAIA